MKKIIEILSFFILYTELINCQTDNSRLDYYPIHIGDTWQYEKIFDFFDGSPLKSWKTVEVTGDTLLHNGRRYYIFEESSNSSINKIYHFRRIDSLSFSVYEYYPYIIGTNPVITCQDSERVIFQLTLNDAEEWTDCSHEAEYYIRHSVAEERVGKINLLRKQMIYLGDYWILLKVLSKDIGLSKYHYGELMLVTETLSYAKINNVEYGEIVGVESHEQNIPTKIRLSQNYPNPFNPSTNITYELPIDTYVKLVVYNSIGEQTKVLVNKYQLAGKYEIEFLSNNLPSGIYFYRLITKDNIISKKFVLLE